MILSASSRTLSSTKISWSVPQSQAKQQTNKPMKRYKKRGGATWCYISAVLDTGTTWEGQSLANLREEKSHLTQTHTYCKNTPAKKRDDQSSNKCMPICCVCTEEPDGSQRDGELTCGNAKLTVHMQVESDLLHFR